ncbi:MAG: hypothetical protein ACPHX8_06895 [Candidatus Poseidoniaceae archaeon]
MLEVLQVVALLLLIVAHGFLIRGCFGIRTELPLQGGSIASKIDRTADLLDEVAQLIADLTDSMPAQPNTQPVSSPMEAILTSLISNIGKPQNHATTSEEREILEINNNPTTTKPEENEHRQFSTEPLGAERHHEGNV